MEDSFRYYAPAVALSKGHRLPRRAADVSSLTRRGMEVITFPMRLRLSLYWLLYMMGLGIFFPYFSLYLQQDQGLSGSQVGLVMAMLPLVGLVAQPMWGYLADRTGSRRRTLAFVTFGMGATCLLLSFFNGFHAMLVATAGLAVFSTVVLSMATAVSLGAMAEEGPHAFGQVRVWGTLGFLVSVLCFPMFLDTWGWRLDLPWRHLGWIFPITFLFATLACIAAIRLPDRRSLTVRSHPGDLARLLRHPPAVRLLILVFLAHICLQGPIHLFPLYITDRGGSAADVGRMWVFMLLLEIPLIAYSGRTLRSLGARGLLTLGLLAEGIRWTTCALTRDLQIVQMAQLLHGVGVAGVIVGAPLYLEQAVPERLRATGQSLISAAGFGAGSIVSITSAGWLFEHVDASTPYRLAGAGALILTLLLFALLPAPYRPSETPS